MFTLQLISGLLFICAVILIKQKYTLCLGRICIPVSKCTYVMVRLLYILCWLTSTLYIHNTYAHYSRLKARTILLLMFFLLFN